jgi:hypothetical protein
VVRQIILVLGILLAVVAIGSAWIDEGEVVQLTTYDARAHPHETDLWIVEVDGRRYVRSDLPGADWLDRLTANPEVELQRDSVKERVLARPIDDPAIREAVDRAMTEKYGFLNRFTGILRDEDAVVPVILEPIPTASR